jgi:hypothetical protein
VRKFLLAAVGAAALVGVTGVANAATFTYTLNTIINGSLTATNFNYGTVTVSDDTTNPNAVDFAIDLFGSGSKVQEFDFNSIMDLSTATLSATSQTYGNLTVDYSSNAVKADGYSAGKFDLVTPDGGSFGNVVEPLTFVLTAKNGQQNINLDASNFNVKDSSNMLYNAVHIGNCVSGTLDCSVGQSIWVGSNGTTPTPAPEPASLALLGVGVAGVGMVARRRQRTVATVG